MQYFLLLLLFMGPYCWAQDILITTQGDTLIGEVYSESEKTVYFGVRGQGSYTKVKRTNISTLKQYKPTRMLKCKWASNKTDPFTNDRMLSTKPEKLTIGGKNIELQLDKVNDYAYVGMEFYRRETDDVTIEPGQQLMLMLDNDSIVTLSTLEYYESEVGTWPKATRIKLPYPIDKEDLRMLATHNVKMIRFYAVGGYVELEAERLLAAEAFRFNAECMLRNAGLIAPIEKPEEEETDTEPIADKLLRLTDLLANGLITEEEFNILKRELMSSSE